VHGQFPGATFLGQGQGLHQRSIPPHLIPHLWSVQVLRNLSPRPGLRHCLVALVVEAIKVWFPTGMALLIQLESRFPPGHWNVFYYRPLAVDRSFSTLCYIATVEKRCGFGPWGAPPWPGVIVVELLPMLFGMISHVLLLSKDST
jgi:hypothetical protein